MAALPENVLSDIGRLDPAAIAEVRSEVWPDVRDAEELHDALQSLIALPDAAPPGPASSPDFVYLQNSIRVSLGAWNKYLEELDSQGRIGRAHADGRAYWVTAEKAKTWAGVFPGGRLATAIEGDVFPREDALRALVNGWLEHSGPVCARSLSQILNVAPDEIEKALLQLEASGTVLTRNGATAACLPAFTA
jgi:ATP-dependent Lhr-like helicase